MLESFAPYAHAAGTGNPIRRMVCCCTTLGIHAENLFPAKAGRDLELTPYLEPLQELRRDFTLFSGVSHPEVDGGHSSEASYLTAAPHPGASSFRNTISLDQLALEKLPPATRFGSGGLVASDMGDRATIGGLSKEFFTRIVKYYTDKYGADSKEFKACRNGATFEPHVAEFIFEQMIKEQPGIQVWHRCRYRGVLPEFGRTEGSDRITALVVDDIATKTTRTFHGDLFIDAGYEGDLMAGAMVPYRVGREARAEYGELLAGVSMGPMQQRGMGDHRTMAYNYRVTVTSDTTNRVLFPKPEHYDRALSLLYYVQNDPALPEAFLIESRKWGLPKDEFTDNGHFPFQPYVREARRMVGAYVLREQDLTQDRWKFDGIATGSYGIDCHTVQFVREGDRLVPEHTRHVACNNYDIPYRSLIPPDVANLLVPVCCSATHIAYCSLRMEPVYMMLGHAAGDAAHLALSWKSSVQNVDDQELRKLLLKEGAVLDCGYQPQVKLTWTPKHPKPGEKVIFKAVSGTLKAPLKQMAWDFDGTGKVGGEGERVVRSFDLEKVHTISLLVTDEAGRKRLLSAEVPVGSTEARDITVDEFDAEMSGRWNGTLPDYVVAKPLRYSDVFTGPGTHRDVVTKGKVGPVRIHFQPTLPRTGRYQVCIGFRPSKAQATNTPITIKHAAGTAKLALDQRTETTPFAFVPVGEFSFKAGNSGSVGLTNVGTDGRIAIDAVRWVWLGE